MYVNLQFRWIWSETPSSSVSNGRTTQLRNSNLNWWMIKVLLKRSNTFEKNYPIKTSFTYADYFLLDEKLQNENVKNSPKNDHDEHLRKNGRFICHRKPFWKMDVIFCKGIQLSKYDKLEVTCKLPQCCIKQVRSHCHLPTSSSSRYGLGSTPALVLALVVRSLY